MSKKLKVEARKERSLSINSCEILLSKQQKSIRFGFFSAQNCSILNKFYDLFNYFK